MSFVRKDLPLIIFGAVSLYLIGAWFIDYKPLTDLGSRILQIGTIAAAFALTLGAVNLFRRHFRIFQKRNKGEWYWSAYVLILFVPLTLWGIAFGSQETVNNWVYQNVYSPLDSAMWGILAPYIVTASFRAFRLKNVESVILTATCFFVLLLNAPVGSTIWAGFPFIGNWINVYVQTAGVISFTIGVAIGTISLFIRTLTGRETASLGYGGQG